MSEIVVVLGAGASRAAGAPLMNDFFDRARSLRRQNRFNDAAARDYDVVEGARWELQRASAKASLDLYNLEHVFVALEMADVIGGVGGLEAKTVPDVQAALRRLIAATIEESIDIRVAGTPEGTRLGAPKGYDNILSWLVTRGARERKAGISFLTFNYDTALDFALFNGSIPFEYCLDDKLDSGVLRLCKLHGSLNWAKPGAGQQIEYVHVVPEHDVRMQMAYQAKVVKFRYAAMLGEASQKNGGDGTPFIVPPTDSKLEYRRAVARVWARAAEVLREATSIIVCGYSLPATDEFFRNFYALATIGKNDIERFWVADPSKDAADRFRHLLSTGVAARFQWFNEDFESFSHQLRTRLP